MSSSREVLCFDLGSGGMSAARFTEALDTAGYNEFSWQMPLSADTVKQAFRQLRHESQCSKPAAIAISSFMHSFLVSGRELLPDSRVYTWMDDAPPQGTHAIRHSIGSEFHRRTGCHYHPMYPVFKLAAMKVASDGRIASPKTLLVEALTGRFVEDFGMAAATGLLNIHSAAWDDDILRAANLTSSNLPDLIEPHAIAGETGSGAVVANGSGDGFAANLGSGCESAKRIAITLGTSAAVRQMVQTPVLEPATGTFCYRATGQDSFLLGCASSNGGNVLDWARREFGVSVLRPVSNRAIPIFLPWLNGERSLEWNSQLRPEWHGRSAGHTPEELFRSVVEGILFNLAQYVEVIEQNSGIRAGQIVLSGNGFLDAGVAPILASLISRETLLPEWSGLGTLRGTAVYAWLALGHDATASVEHLVSGARRIAAAADAGLSERFARFKELRRSSRNTA